MKKNLVSIIIVNWNGEKLLRDCINSLRKVTYKNTEIIVVDNNSNDGSLEYLKGLRSAKFRLIANRENKGFAEANNIGVEHARGEYILFLNNDTVVDRNFLTTLVNKLQSDRRIAAVQPKILQHPDRKLIDSVGSYFINSGFLYHPGHNKKDRGQFDTPSQVFTMKGACMLYRKSVLDTIGVFDTGYFAYFEETDLCHRTLINNHEIWYEPASVIFHKGGETSRKINVARINYYSYRNRIFTYLKNFDISTLLKVLPIHLILCEVVAAGYLATLRIGLFLAIQKAIIWNTVNIPLIMKSRRKVQLLRKTNDDMYLKRITKSVRPSYYYHLFSTALRGYDD